MSITNRHSFSPERRRFLQRSVLAAGSLSLLAAPAVFGGSNEPGNAKVYTVQEIIDLILKEGGLSPFNGTVDTIKAGSPSQQVTGIVTTMFATVPIIEQAAKLKANFIIAHEPTFYNHRDDINWVRDNAIVKRKLELLDKYKIAVWRFHDYCHSLRPDAVSYGVAKKANWLNYYKTGQSILSIPSIKLGALVEHLKKSLGIDHVRVIGNPDQSCSKIGLIPGAAGGQRQVSFIESEKPDVLIVGEVAEWETAEYIRDGQLLGGKTSLIVLGHAQSEEPGMEYFVDWLQPKLDNIKVSHIASGNPFVWR